MRSTTTPYSSEELQAMTAAYPGVFAMTRETRLRLAAFWAVAVVSILIGLWRTGFFNWQAIWHGVDKVGTVVAFMLPPAHNGWLGEFLYAILETVCMAFLGTLIATLVSIPLGFMGAKNVVSNLLFHFSFRRIFDGIRGVDALIWALVFVNVVGLGPFAGIMAIAVSDIGTLSKLFAEAIENIDRKQVEGVHASGASRIQTIRFAIFPQIFPVILSNALYYFESNIRSATILGVVGAGGIGLQLSDRIRVNNWDEAAFIILLILGTVGIIDTLSKEIRTHMINFGKVRG